MFYVRFNERYIYSTWQSYTIVIREMRPYGVRFLTDAPNPPIHLIAWTLISLTQNLRLFLDRMFQLYGQAHYRVA